MTDLPAEYYWHELNKLLGDCKLKPGMPCFRCNEPEAMDITVAFAKFGAAAHDALPRGTMPALDAIVAEPLPEAEPTLAPPDPEPDDPFSLRDDDLFILRDYVIGEDEVMAAAIKAAGGIHMLARKLALDHATIEQWRRIPFDRLRAVANVTGLPQHVLRPDLFPHVGDPQLYWTEEEADEIWKWSRAWQLWLPLPYPPGFLPARCCARRSRLTLVVIVAKMAI